MKLMTHIFAAVVAMTSAGSSFAYAEDSSSRSLLPNASFATSVSGARFDMWNLSLNSPSNIGASLFGSSMPLATSFYAITSKNGVVRTSSMGDITASPTRKPTPLGMLLVSLGLMGVIGHRRMKVHAG